MRTITRRIIGAAVLCLQAVYCCAADSDDRAPTLIEKGKVALDLRLRYEGASEENTNDAEAITLRTALSVQTGPFTARSPWSALLELENTLALSDKDYSDGVQDRDTAIIADPPGTEINQLYLAYRPPGGFSAKIGRQTIALGDERFVGAVGFRQNNQSFDALSLNYKSLEDVQLFYAYVRNANRIFGDDADGLPAGRLGDHEQRTHLLNAVYSGWSASTVESYAYLIDNNDFQRATTDTYGIRFSGSVRPAALTYLYSAEFAHQRSGSDNPASYAANFWRLSGGVSYKRLSVQFTQEHLGSDNNSGFVTPLATLHKFQGWADKFVALTPNEGLVDNFVTIAGRWPGFRYRLRYHRFETDVGSRSIGSEIGLQLQYRVGQKYLFEAKYADYRSADRLALPGGLNNDTQRAFLSFSMKFGSTLR